jgi:hypothetical protein
VHELPWQLVKVAACDDWATVTATATVMVMLVLHYFQ